MQRQKTRPWMLLTVPLTALFPTFASCSSSSDGSGIGGPSAGTGGVASSAGGADSGLGGTPFMSLAGKDSGACRKTGEPCTMTGDCCSGNLCNRYGPAPEWIGCQVACTQNSECPSGCCYHFQGQNGGFCTDAKWCACGMSGNQCGSTFPTCCTTHVCVGVDQAGTTYACRQKCTQNTDCDTACCVAIPSLGVSACLDKSYCP